MTFEMPPGGIPIESVRIIEVTNGYILMFPATYIDETGSGTVIEVFGATLQLLRRLAMVYERRLQREEVRNAVINTPQSELPN